MEIIIVYMLINQSVITRYIDLIEFLFLPVDYLTIFILSYKVLLRI